MLYCMGASTIAVSSVKNAYGETPPVLSSAGGCARPRSDCMTLPYCSADNRQTRREIVPSGLQSVGLPPPPAVPPPLPVVVGVPPAPPPLVPCGAPMPPLLLPQAASVAPAATRPPQAARRADFATFPVMNGVLTVVSVPSPRPASATACAPPRL